MQVFDQVRTSQGQIPVADAQLASEPGESAPAWIDFRPMSAQELAKRPAKKAQRASGAPIGAPGAPGMSAAPADSTCSIENLSVIATLPDALTFARTSGPLFGMSLRCIPHNL